MAEVRENPYWDAVKDHAREPRHRIWGRGLIVGEPDWDAPPSPEKYAIGEMRHEFVKRYSWTITDPATIGTIVEYAAGRPLVDPCAGSGYWGWMLKQEGLDVLSYDVAPPPNHEYYDRTYTRVAKLDGAEAARRNSGRVLFLSWPPYASSVGHDIVRAYEGDEIIYIGESDGGCCGDESLWRLIDLEWAEVRGHRPVQWWGMHDLVIHYKRRTVPAKRRAA